MTFLKKYIFIFFIELIFFNVSLFGQYVPAIELTDEYFNKLINKNVGILCNNNSKICERHLID